MELMEALQAHKASLVEPQDIQWRDHNDRYQPSRPPATRISPGLKAVTADEFRRHTDRMVTDGNRDGKTRWVEGTLNVGSFLVMDFFQDDVMSGCIHSRIGSAKVPKCQNRTTCVRNRKLRASGVEVGKGCSL